MVKRVHFLCIQATEHELPELQDIRLRASYSVTSCLFISSANVL